MAYMHRLVQAKYGDKEGSFPFAFHRLNTRSVSKSVSHCFLDGFLGYNQIVIAAKVQEKTIFTFLFRTFGLCNALTTFQRCMISIFSTLIKYCIKVFMDDFIVYGDSSYACQITYLVC